MAKCKPETSLQNSDWWDHIKTSRHNPGKNFSIITPIRCSSLKNGLNEILGVGSKSYMSISI